jgi:GT2 family glycosyltransferase
VKHYVEQCLHSVEKAIEGLDIEVFVVDNHSHDDSVTYLRKRFPWVTVIANNHNSGYSRANNIAIRQTQGDYVLLLNPDTIVGEDTLRESVAFMDQHPDAGALGVQMLKTNGEKARESRRGLPTPMTAFYKVCGLCDAFPESKRYGKYYMGYLPWDEASEIEIVSGAYCMLRRSALDQVGLLDEDFFMYGEDIDLSYRLVKGGYHNWYLPALILHYKGESTKKSSFRYVHVFYDAMLIFFRKHFSQMTILLSLPIKAAIYFKAFIALLGMLSHRVRKMMGFTVRRHKEQPHYLFIGLPENLEKCRKLAMEKGLDAAFREGDELSNPMGHLDEKEQLSKYDCVYVVYDTEAYRYKTMLDIMASDPMEQVFLGTYSSQTNLLITEKEVM